MKWLIVNGDDFGLHPLINQGIITAHQEGILTSTSLVACGSAFDDAVVKALQYPKLGIGIHLTFVEEKPVSPPEAIPSLVGRNGRFWKSWKQVLTRFFTGRIQREELRTEAMAQISRVLDAGLTPTHVDSHQHLHLSPAFRKVLFPIIEQCRIPGIRMVNRELMRVSLGWKSRGLEFLSHRAMPQVKLSKLWCPESVAGTSLGGHWSLSTLQELMKRLPNGATEIICHPGKNDQELAKCYDWGYHWDEETAALITPSLRALIAENGIQLCRFESQPVGT